VPQEAIKTVIISKKYRIKTKRKPMVLVIV